MTNEQERLEQIFTNHMPDGWSGNMLEEVQQLIVQARIDATDKLLQRLIAKLKTISNTNPRRLPIAIEYISAELSQLRQLLK